MNILLWTLQILFIPLFSPLAIGVTRKIKAKFQNRKGAPILQPYNDIYKLFNKDEVISKDASWIFKFAPYLVFAVTLLVGASIPIIASSMNIITGDFLTIIYLIALATFFLALAGIDIGSPFGGFGSSREMFLAALSEGGLLMSLLTLALACNSTNLFTIASNLPHVSASFILPISLAFISFAIAMLAETSRYPFDNPSTHLELTMIHEAMILEYSGKKLALMEWAAANKYLIFIVLGANLFFPWGMVSNSSVSLLNIVSAGVLLIFKILLFCTSIAILESSIAKFRIFRLPDLLLTSFIISLIAIGLVV